ncbi:MAG: c-type cytochrome [Xanthomonadales bacterium]|jgi:cytochrome c553|nr:c-type cytochrome [Xanthomonadales bacterium]
MKALLGVTASLFLLTANVALAEGDAEAGQQKSATCAACHGADGNSVVAMWPKIAGQHEQYLVRHIQLIKSNARPVPEMYGIAQTLSDQDILDLAAYYSSQTMSPGAADEALVPLGKQVYLAGNPEAGVPSCASCHGPTGQGNPLAGYPWLSGQHATYTTSMLNKYRDGTQWGPDDANSAVMVGVAKGLSDEEIAAVASYIEGLHRAE